MDAFTLAVVEGALAEASDEIFATLMRTSQSTIIYEVLDYATGILEPKGRLITQGNGVTGFLGSLSGSVRALLEGGMPLEEGDVWVVNDPYTAGGTHLSDVSLVAPVLLDGTLLGFTAAKAHWTEVGGMAAGSWTTDAPDVFAEGIQLPLVRVKRRGAVVDDVVAIITKNVRTPDATYGDVMAQMASIETGARRIQAIGRKYGADVVIQAMEGLLERGERTARETLARLPHGVFLGEDRMDDDGAGGDPVTIRVTITITDDAFVCDFTGTDPSVKGTINCTYPSLVCGVRTAFRALLPLDRPTNDGMFAPLVIACPPGTVFTAERPTPVSTYWEASDHATDLVLKALAPHMEGQVPAGHSLSVCGTIVAFEGPEPKILIEPMGGGWGGSEGRDGESALIPIGDGDTCSTPVEILEAVYPIRCLSVALIPDSAGGGTFRGGLGQVRSYELLAPAKLTTAWGRCVFPPWGLMGGTSGTVNKVVVDARDEHTEAGKITRLQLAPGDHVALVTGGGGGYGPPEGRDARAVRSDIEAGYLSAEGARALYGHAFEEVL